MHIRTYYSADSFSHAEAKSEGGGGISCVLPRSSSQFISKNFDMMFSAVGAMRISARAAASLGRAVSSRGFHFASLSGAVATKRPTSVGNPKETEAPSHGSLPVEAFNQPPTGESVHLLCVVVLICLGPTLKVAYLVRCLYFF